MTAADSVGENYESPVIVSAVDKAIECVVPRLEADFLTGVFRLIVVVEPCSSEPPVGVVAASEVLVHFLFCYDKSCDAACDEQQHQYYCGYFNHFFLHLSPSDSLSSFICTNHSLSFSSSGLC